MKKGIKYVSLLAVVVLAATGFPFGSASLQPARALTLLQDSSDFLVWQRSSGITPGQIARITVANLAETRSPGPLTFQCMVFDPNGVLVFQTERREVPPRGFRYEDIIFGDLGAIVGEPGTERKQVLMKLSVQAPRGTSSSKVRGSLEILNGDTGKTVVYQTYPDLIVTTFQHR